MVNRKDGKLSKSSRSESIEGDKRPKKREGESSKDSKSNGKTSSSGEPSSPATKRSSKRNKRLDAVPEEHGDSEDRVASRGSKGSKAGTPVARAPIAEEASDGSGNDSSDDHDAHKPSTSEKSKPMVPPKPTNRTPAGSPVVPGRPRKSTASSSSAAQNTNAPVNGSSDSPHPSSTDDEDSSIEEKKGAKRSSIPVDHPSGQASKLTDSSDDSDAEDSIDDETVLPIKPAKKNELQKSAPSAGKPVKVVEEESDDGSASVHSVESADPKPKVTKQTPSSTGSQPKASSSAPASSTDKEPKDKKKGGLFSFLSKMGSKKHDDKKRDDGTGDKDKGNRDLTPEKRRDTEKRTYVASCVAELPDDWQKKLKKSHLDEATLNQHFYILCNVLHFLTKDSFRMPDQEKEVRERRTYASVPMMEAAKQLLETTDNIKRYYKNIEFSGKGGFGRVFAAKDIGTKKRVAIKKLPHGSDKDRKNNYCEIAFLSTCNHANIVKFNRSWEFPDKQEVWIVTEFLEGGTLSEAVKVHQFTERHIAYVAREILKALKYLHSMGYIHRDLKSGNVMMSIEGQIKLIDFGLCCDTADGDRLQMLGSPYWIPPEMIKKKRHGCPADIWSFAVCVLEMYLKEPPHCDSRLYAMFTAASAGLQSAIPARASENARDFLSKCLEINPKKRWTAEQLLTHPFVTAPKLEEGIRDVLRGVFVSNSLALSGI